MTAAPELERGAGGKREFAHLMRPGSLGIPESCKKSTSQWCLDML